MVGSHSVSGGMLSGVRCFGAVLILLAVAVLPLPAQPASMGVPAVAGNFLTADGEGQQIDLQPEKEFRGPAVRSLSVADLQQVLAAAQGDSDPKLAKQLSTMELTERLSDARCDRLKGSLRGKRSRVALQVLADASAFLRLPAADIPNRPAPDLATQQHILQLTVDYVTRLAHVLPNLYATEQTLSFRNSPREVLLAWKQGMVPLWQPLKQVGHSSMTVTYRDDLKGEDAPGKALRPNPRNRPLVTTGEFGPILRLVLFDAAHGSLQWGHWEQGASGLEAVFAYAVPLPQSQYQPGYCCVRGHVFQQRRAYYGEIAVNPASGVVLHLTLETNGSPGDVLVWTGTMVHYGDVELGGKSYICPLRTVSITQGRPEAAAEPAAIAGQSTGILFDEGWLETLLNDTVFEDYHLFRASVRILPSR